MNKNLSLLVYLQDIDNLLRDATDPEQRDELAKLGFVLQNVTELEGLRAKVRQAIDPSLVRTYDRLAGVYKRRAVVPIVSGTCSGCFGTLPTKRLQEAQLGDKILTCEHCGRILFWV